MAGEVVVVLVRQRGMGGAEDILRARPGAGDVPAGVVYQSRTGTVLRLHGGSGGVPGVLRATAKEHGADILGLLRANGTPGRGGGLGSGIAGVLRSGAAPREPVAASILGLLRADGPGAVYQYNVNTGALTRLTGVGDGDILGVLRHAAKVNEPGIDILGALCGNESAADFYYDFGTTAQELGLDAGHEFRSMLAYGHGMDAGHGKGIVGVLPANAGGGDVFRAVLVREPGLATGRRVEGIVGVLPADGADAVYPYTTGTIPDLLGMGGGRVEGIHRVLAANDSAALYYYKLIPNSPHEPRMGIAGRGEGLSVPIPKEDSGAGYYYSGMPENKTGMVTDVVVTFDDDDAYVDKAAGDLVAAAGGSKFAGHVRRGLGVVGIAAASLAVTELAAGAGTAGAGFGLFMALLCGVTLVTLRVLPA